MLNYREQGKHHAKGEWAKGVAIMDATAQTLRKEGLLPERFPQPETSALALPEGAVRLPDLTIGGKTPKELERVLASGGFRVSDWAKDMLRSRDFITRSEEQDVSLVRVRLSDLGLTDFSTLSQILEKASTFGLGECPAEVGPHLRLTLKDQPMGDWFSVAMKPRTDSYGDPRVFELARDEDGSWLDGSFARPDTQWVPGGEFVFTPRPRTEAQRGLGQASPEA